MSELARSLPNVAALIGRKCKYLCLSKVAHRPREFVYNGGHLGYFCGYGRSFFRLVLFNASRRARRARSSLPELLVVEDDGGGHAEETRCEIVRERR